MLKLVLFLFCLFLSLLIFPLVWAIKRNPFIEKEVERYADKICEEPNDDSWSSEGRLYTRGLTLVEDKNGKKKFIKQVKLCDIGLFK